MPLDRAWTKRPFRLTHPFAPSGEGPAAASLDDPLKNDQPPGVKTFTPREPASPEQVGRALDHLRAYVRQHGLKNSQVREKVLEGAMAFAGHFTVEDLVRALRDLGMSNVHTATVYRSLPLLIDAGLVEPALIAGGDGQLYESAFEQDHHDHLVCVRCRQVVEFYSEPLEAIQREIAERYGYILQDHVHELRGLCGDCRKQSSGEPP